MRAAEIFSRTRSVDSFNPDVVLELLSLANKFCSGDMKSACDAYLASLVYDMERAMLLIDSGLDETAPLLVAACLQVFMKSYQVQFTIQVQMAMEVDMKANTTVMLLERLGDCANEHWQTQIAFHQLGCVMLEREEYKRCPKVLGGCIRKRSLYCSGEEKMMDLDTATELDPTLSYRYKYRAVMMMEENKIGEAISEINRIIGFKVSPDCLELVLGFQFPWRIMKEL
ncbi:Ethylene-overproduction protein 1 [Camellia lanceoleosa]|uniref:Ethylene-overproduction protein 1 n=1 Tax=Camellia lanceoleosa TaxID=1840588 RepID=A0ACC0HV51_9ERIC|nr:Ethylene-overproduction protein 1 [Camellia lanceoleosa]